MRARSDRLINNEATQLRQASTACPGRPEPQALATFLRSKLQPREPDPLYRELLRLRRELPRELETEADEEAQVLRLRRGDVTLVADFGNRRVEFSTG